MTIEIKVGPYKLEVAEKDSTWYATCHGFFDRLELDAKSQKSAKREALEQLKSALEGVLSDIEMRLARL